MPIQNTINCGHATRYILTEHYSSTLEKHNWVRNFAFPEVAFPLGPVGQRTNPGYGDAVAGKQAPGGLGLSRSRVRP